MFWRNVLPWSSGQRSVPSVEESGTDIGRMGYEPARPLMFYRSFEGTCCLHLQDRAECGKGGTDVGRGTGWELCQAISVLLPPRLAYSYPEDGGSSLRTFFRNTDVRLHGVTSQNAVAIFHILSNNYADESCVFFQD
jgi:hypothetical protein